MINLVASLLVIGMGMFLLMPFWPSTIRNILIPNYDEYYGKKTLSVYELEQKMMDQWERAFAIETGQIDILAEPKRHSTISFGYMELSAEQNALPDINTIRSKLNTSPAQVYEVPRHVLKADNFDKQNVKRDAVGRIKASELSVYHNSDIMKLAREEYKEMGSTKGMIYLYDVIGKRICDAPAHVPNFDSVRNVYNILNALEVSFRHKHELALTMRGAARYANAMPNSSEEEVSAKLARLEELLEQKFLGDKIVIEPYSTFRRGSSTYRNLTGQDMTVYIKKG